LAIAVSFINWSMEQKKLKLDIGSILIIGAGDSQPKPHKPCGTMRFEI